MNEVWNPNELCHHGIKGQKWGIRNYQLEDGSLTEQGRLRYSKDKKDRQEYKKLKTELKQLRKDSMREINTKQKEMNKQYAIKRKKAYDRTYRHERKRGTGWFKSMAKASRAGMKLEEQQALGNYYFEKNKRAVDVEINEALYGKGTRKANAAAKKLVDSPEFWGIDNRTYRMTPGPNGKVKIDREDIYF